jgi:DNA repair exonuclease SbcCD ATPase subunit
MRGRRGTLQPVRAGRKSPTLFAPSRSPIDAIAPAATAVSTSESSITNTGMHRMDMDDVGMGMGMGMGIGMGMDVPGTDDESSSSEVSSASSPSTPPTSSSLMKKSSRKSLQQQEYVYSLQDENADLRKAIHSLEIIMRDHGFAKDGKLIIPTDEIVRIDNDKAIDEEGNSQRTPPQQYMEMMSMMGMDPERPTVLTRYMEYKVTELQDDLETMESDRNRLAKLVETLSAKSTEKDSLRSNRLRDSKTQKRKLEEKVTTAINFSKRRETQLSQQVGGLESNLEKSQLQEGVLLQRIAELESELESALLGSNSKTTGAASEDHLEDSFDKEDLLADYFKPLKNTTAAMQQSLSDISKQHNQQLEEWKREESKEREEQLTLQVSALETNLEWNMQESKKQEDLLREQVTDLETNLEWNFEKSTKREALLQERINELETKTETIENNNEEIESEDSLTVDSLLEQKKQLEKIQRQKSNLEEWLSKVVEESTKR